MICIRTTQTEAGGGHTMLKRSLLGVILGAVVLAAAVPVSAATFKIDEFKVLKTGVGTFFDDTFSDGVPPPGGPSGWFCSPTCYGTLGVFSESGGRAIMDTSLGALATSPIGVSGQVNAASLLSNTSNSTAPATLALGLKRGSSFTVEGTFDLATPGPAIEQYGISLSDRTFTPTGDDVLRLAVVRAPDSNVYVSFFELDFVNSSQTLIERRSSARPWARPRSGCGLNTPRMATTPRTPESSTPRLSTSTVLARSSAPRRRSRIPARSSDRSLIRRATRRATSSGRAGSSSRLRRCPSRRRSSSWVPASLS